MYMTRPSGCIFGCALISNEALLANAFHKALNAVSPSFCMSGMPGSCSQLYAEVTLYYKTEFNKKCGTSRAQVGYEASADYSKPRY